MRVIMSMNVLMPSWSYSLLMSNVLFKPSLDAKSHRFISWVPPAKRRRKTRTARWCRCSEPQAHCRYCFSNLRFLAPSNCGSRPRTGILLRFRRLYRRRHNCLFLLVHLRRALKEFWFRILVGGLLSPPVPQQPRAEPY